MTITNGYTTLEAMRTVLKFQQNDSEDDAALEAAIEVASRQIDDTCGKGRKFWQDSTVVARTYYPSSSRDLNVDDISTVTGLIVKVDTSDDGTFDTTLTINTDFVLLPTNAAAEYPVRAWETIRLLDGTLSSWSALSSGRPSVQVTAKFGWPAVPEQVERACVFQTKTLFKAPDLLFGSFQLGDDGAPQRIPSMDPLARAMLEQFVRYTEVDDGG
jgi:hypothetical protein